MTRLMTPEPMTKADRKTVTARIDQELVRKANTVASLRGISTVEYLDTILRPVIEGDFKAEIAKEAKRQG